MIVYKNCLSFKVLDHDVSLISEELDTGINTVAEINNKFYYLGHENPDISVAIFAYQEFYDRSLSVEELRQVMIDNNLISSAV